VEHSEVNVDIKTTYPSSSPFLRYCPSLTVVSHVDTSVIPMPRKAIKPIFGLSASMKMIARVATADRYSWLTVSPSSGDPSDEEKSSNNGSL
jgi:hypothetical protein